MTMTSFWNQNTDNLSGIIILQFSWTKCLTLWVLNYIPSHTLLEGRKKDGTSRTDCLTLFL